eukprot:30087-Pelagococcus_subviridis.AAC.27
MGRFPSATRPSSLSARPAAMSTEDSRHDVVRSCSTSWISVLFVGIVRTKPFADAPVAQHPSHNQSPIGSSFSTGFKHAM